MTGTQAIAYMQAISWRGSKPGLERTQALLAALGNPEKTLKFVHIAGTNGKGSTAAMLSSILRRAGYRTGLFTSPFLQRFHERMQIDGLPIPDDELGRVTEALRPYAESLPDKPTEFELMTCAAFQWFAYRGCDLVVLETGMGGRLDSTNVIGPPEAAVITAIGLDHTRELGDTVEKIAGEKAGIIKAGAPVVLYEAQDEVRQVLLAACRDAGAAVTQADFSKLHVRRDDLEGQVFGYGPWRDVRLALLGAHQRKNAAVALETVAALRARGWTIPHRAVYEGLAEARWPGRFEILRRRPLFVADGGHNPQCAEALAANLAHYFPGKRIHLLLGVLADKDWTRVMDTVALLAASFTAVAPDSPRALAPEELGDYLRRFGKPVSVCPSVAAGVEAVLGRAGGEDVVCSFGSLYLTGAVRTLLLP